MKKLRKTSKKRIILKKKSSKKAQFFLMAAIIIVMVLYTLTINYNWIKESVELGDYPGLRENQGKELPKVINRAIFITTDPSKCKEPNPDPNCPIPAAEDFTAEFQKYASKIDPNYGSVLILRDPYTGDIIVKNLLAKDQDGKDRYIKIDAKDYSGKEIILKDIWSETTTTEGTINLNIGGHEMFATTVHASITSWGEGLTKQNIGNVQSLQICVSEKDCIPIDLSDPSSLSRTVTNSQDNTGNINYDVCPPPKKADGSYMDNNCF